MAFALLVLAAAVAAPPPPADPPADPAADLHQMVVQAIRDCGQRGDEIVACSPDRGFAEGEGRRVRKLKRPKPVDTGGGIKVQVTTGPPSSAPRQ